MLDLICGAPLAVMPYRPQAFEDWLLSLKVHVESRPRLLLVDRGLGADPRDGGQVSRVATGYGVDSVLLDLRLRPPSCQPLGKPQTPRLTRYRSYDGPCCRSNSIQSSMKPGWKLFRRWFRRYTVGLIGERSSSRRS